MGLWTLSKLLCDGSRYSNVVFKTLQVFSLNIFLVLLKFWWQSGDLRESCC